MTKNTKYVSDATLFIRDFLKQHPDTKTKQKTLRQTWWDNSKIDQGLEQGFTESASPVVGGYSYYSYNK